ncbi:hypothetical protein DFS34DRAFT_390601 [Phlyctochytrium arcticum]|nr:hypothetical protein DFS34DRAFT_390601 [Phlyctochytrium arcticum]
MSLLRRNRFSEALSVPTAITPYPRQPAHTDRDVNDIWREVREKKQKIQALDGKFEALKTELITLKAEVQVREAENERIRAAAESKDDKARLQLTQAKTLREFELLLQRQEAKAQFYAAQTGAVREIFERAKTLGSDAESKNDLCKEIARVIGIIDQTCDSMGPTEEELPLQQFLDSSFAISGLPNLYFLSMYPRLIRKFQNKNRQPPTIRSWKPCALQQPRMSS